MRSSSLPQPAKKLPPHRMTLSLCMIVKDEAGNLGDCIGPIRSVVDEIIVVDTGSTDGTHEVARRLGAKVFDFPWRDDFSAARNESIRHATGDYILWLDADDRMDQEEVKKLETLKSGFSRQKDEAYFLIIRNQSQVDGETRFRQLRIFPNIEGAFFEGCIHEQIHHRLKSLGVKGVDTDIEIRHQGYHGPDEVIRKSERNLRIIRNALEAEPENIFLHYQAARTLAGLNRLDEAIEHIRKVVEHPRVREKEKRFCFDATLFLSQWEMEMGRYEEAGHWLEEAAHLSEGHPLLHFYRGDFFYQIGDYEKAIGEMLTFLRGPVPVGTIPVNTDWLLNYPFFVLWQCYLGVGETSKADEMFEALLSRPQIHSRCLEELGLRCLKKGLFSEAVTFYQRAAAEGEATDATHSNLGLALWKAGRTEEAKKAFEKALEINPERLEALTNLGHLYHQQGDDQRARGYFERALSFDPNLIDVRLGLSEIFFRAYEPDGLVEQCDQLLKILGLPRNVVVESLKDLSLLFEKVGEKLLVQKQDPLAMRAFYLSFLFHPSKEGMEGLIEKAKRQGRLGATLKQIEEALAFYGMTESTIGERATSAPPTISEIQVLDSS